MRIGALLPHGAPGFGSDIGAIAEFTQAAEALGYDHIRMGEHVLGINPSGRPGWKGPYSYEDPFHDPFVLFAYLAGLTETLEFATCILILPQRQTAVVAKQASTLDLVSGGRLRLGIGIGWEPGRVRSSGRGLFIEGTAMRRADGADACPLDAGACHLPWTVGHDHRRGPQSLPVQRPIPIWIGGGPGSIWIGGRGSGGGTSTANADRVLRRIARMADGWFPSVRLDTGAREAVPIPP